MTMDQRCFIRVSQWDEPIACLGNPDILRKDKLALFCSRKCPGDLILKAYDLARELRERGVTVISGFHTPVEKECLRILLRGTQPLIICPARSIESMCIPLAWRKPLEQGRLLILSPFKEGQRRMTAKLAERRNLFVVTLADELLFIHAAEGSVTSALAERCISEGKAVRFLD